MDFLGWIPLNGNFINMEKNNFERGKANPLDTLEIGNEWYRKFGKVEFFVEANSFETFTLWQEYHNEKDIEWIQELAGFVETIGYINNRPINLEFSFNVINGKLIAFYSGISALVDHTMIEEWIESRFPVKYDHGGRRAMTNAQNFHNCIQFCKGLRK
jgi:hypothetical protein